MSMTPVPAEAASAAHEAVFAIVDDAVTDIAGDVTATGSVTVTTIRRHLRRAADLALDAAAQIMREAECQRAENYRQALTRFEHLEAAAQELAARQAARAECDRICAMGEQFELAFREFVDEEEAADCALKVIEMIRGDHG